MTSDTQYGCGTTTVDPDAEQTYTNTKQVAPGVTFTLHIAGDKETTDQGRQALRALGNTVAEQVTDLASSRYVFTETVERDLGVYDGDDYYSLTVAFTPTKRRDLRNGKSMISALNALDRALAAAHRDIVDRASLAEQMDNAPVVDVLVFVAETPRRRGSFFGLI